MSPGDVANLMELAFFATVAGSVAIAAYRLAARAVRAL